MKFISQPISLAAIAVLSFALAGCGREDVKVQRVPKDEAPAPQPAASDMQPQAGPIAPGATMPMDSTHSGLSMGGGAATQPKLKWTALPEGWQEKPVSEFRAASFSVKGKDGQEADVSVIPLPSTGREVDLVNMWRQQMHLPAITQEAADKDAEKVTVGPSEGKLFDIASQDAILDDKSKARMTVVMVERDGVSWFFKMAGEDTFVHSQKPAFIQFLKSVSFESAPATVAADPHAGMTTDAAAAAPATSNANVPAGWKEVPATQFLLAKYVIQSNGAEASVNVSMLDGTGGGLLPNVNRWRGQLGLPPISEGELTTQTQSLDVAGTKATLVDINGAKGRLIGIIAPQAGQTWFYKLMGDAQIVEQQKDAFTKFVQNFK